MFEVLANAANDDETNAFLDLNDIEFVCYRIVSEPRKRKPKYQVAYELINDCCLKALANIPNGSIQMMLADLPYGTTNCPWDSLIDLPAFWTEINRILTPTGTAVMFASHPFTTMLSASNLEQHKYTLVWEKTRPTGFQHAKTKPMKTHEDVLVFSRGTTIQKTRGNRHMTYNPQGLVELDKPREPKLDIRKAGAFTQAADREFAGKKILGNRKAQTHTNYPTSVLKFASEGNTVHPTQKPVALCEYLIRTYSNEGDTILDPTMGSGTAGVAARFSNRFFIGIERDPEFYRIAEDRIANALNSKAA